MNVVLRSITLKTAQVQKIKSFYEALGLSFQSRKVDKGSELFVTKFQDIEMILMSSESAKTQIHHDIQWVFKVPSVRETCAVMAQKQAYFLMEPTDMPEGTMAILQDPDGRALQIVEN